MKNLIKLTLSLFLQKVFGVVNDAVKSGGIYVDAATIFDRQKTATGVYVQTLTRKQL